MVPYLVPCRKTGNCLSVSLSVCLCVSVFVCLSQLAEPEDRMLAVKQNTHTIKSIFCNKKYVFDYLKKRKENREASYIVIEPLFRVPDCVFCSCICLFTVCCSEFSNCNNLMNKLLFLAFQNAYYLSRNMTKPSK